MRVHLLLLGMFVLTLTGQSAGSDLGNDRLREYAAGLRARAQWIEAVRIAGVELVP